MEIKKRIMNIKKRNFGLSIGMGAAIGISIGVAMNNIGAGVAIGIGIGVAFSAIPIAKKEGQNKENDK
jgi:hypothetical protein